MTNKLLLLCVSTISLAAQTELIVNIAQQKLYLLQNNKIIKTYPISTSGYGIGSVPDSNHTPLGKHVVYQKVGAHVKRATIFKGGVKTGRVAEIFTDKVPMLEQQDLITTRILQLDGQELRNATSKRRGIWVHGTPYEGDIGTAVSHGCVRMKNHDIEELFELVDVGTVLNFQLN